MEFVKNIPAKLGRHNESGTLRPLAEAHLYALNHAVGGAVLARYHKGLCGMDESCVIVQFASDRSQAHTANAERSTVQQESRLPSAPVPTATQSTTS